MHTARVLVADDDGSVRQALVSFLKAAGYAVFEAADGQAAIAACREHEVDLVVTDMYMPGVDGMEVIMRLRSEFPATQIVAMSGGGFVDVNNVLAAARTAGAVRTLAKPFSKDDLLKIASESLAAR